MSRILSALAAVVISFTGFHDWNGNWALDSGEQLAAGQFRLYVTASDGAVSMTQVSLPAGNWYRLELDPGDQVRIESGCGSVTIQTGNVWYVPVFCGSVLLPMIGGGL